MTPEPASDRIARLVHYSGQVQGVGFRATTAHLARRFAVTGWVRNLADGRVGLLAEGTSSEVERFLQAIRSNFEGYIDDEETTSPPPTHQYRSFEVVR